MWRLIRNQGMHERLLGAGLLLAAAALVAAPGEAAAGAKNGLTLCFNVIIPSLFPFFVLSSLAVDLGLAACLGRALEKVMRPLFRVSGSCAAAVALGFIGGYPVGARTALQLYRQGLCSKTETERLLAFCNNSGPAFILGVVGTGVFEDSRIGVLLYCTHAAASLLVGILFRFYGGDRAPQPSAHPKPIRTVTFPTALTGAVTQAMQSSLNICAFVIFFAAALRLLSALGIIPALAGLLARIGLPPEWAERLIAGILELSSGVTSLTGGSGIAGRASMAAFMLGWAGFSVHCQVLSFLADSGISPKTYLAGKLCHGLVAAALTWALTALLPAAVPVTDYLAEQTEALAALEFSTSLTLSLVTAFAAWILLVGIAAVQIRKKSGKKSRYHL